MLKKAKKDVDMRCEMELYMLIYVDDHVFFSLEINKVWIWLLYKNIFLLIMYIINVNVIFFISVMMQKYYTYMNLILNKKNAII